MENGGTSEHLIENVLGCGRFQVLMVFMVCLMTKMPVVYTFMFMAYGNYNPGWRCLDSLNYTHANGTRDGNTTVPVYIKDSCPEFEACQNVEFNPEASTIVTEWALLCKWEWIPSLIISIQMAGALFGSYVAGQCSDSFGRKTTIYGSIATLGVLNLISIFSTSWPMFIVLRFFLGMGAGGVLAVYYVLTSEFLTMKWRAPLSSIPAWNVSAVLFSLTAMVLRDWKHIHAATAVLSALTFLPALWVPESLRWLEVKGKTKKFMKVAHKMANLNKKQLPPDMPGGLLNNSGNPEQLTVVNNYTLLDLFRPGYQMYTVLMGLLWMFMSLIYYAITFGVKAMYGNFYINLIIVFAVQAPFSIFPIIAPNILGRRLGSFIFLCLSAFGLVGATCFEKLSSGEAKTIGTLIMIMAGKVGMSSGWDINKIHLTEVYPTVVRGLSLGWACLMARIGGIIAPFLIPNDLDAIFICYAVMATLALVCCFIVTRFPETRNKPLKETFTDVCSYSDDTQFTGR